MNMKWLGLILLLFGFVQAAALYTIFPLPQILNALLIFAGTWLYVRHRSR